MCGCSNYVKILSKDFQSDTDMGNCCISGCAAHCRYRGNTFCPILLNINKKKLDPAGTSPLLSPAASPWVILDGSVQASSSLSNTHGHEYSHQCWGRSRSGPRSEDTQGATEEPIKPQDKGHWWLSCRAYFHCRPLRRDSVTQATGCLLIPGGLLHFAHSSLLHLE